MRTFSVPDLSEFNIENLVLDYNGTFAYKGESNGKVLHLLKEISKNLKIYIVTANTFGKINHFKDQLPVEIHIFPPENQVKLKADFIKIIGEEKTIAIGNGSNDARMLKEAAIGIAVIENKIASFKAIENANIVRKSIIDALYLILNPDLIFATLRQ